MEIGLLNLEPTINNSAMMQVSQYYKQNGHNVWEYNPLFDYDKIYAFSLFDFTEKKYFVPPNAICGGTGFDIRKRLPNEIESCDLDYSIFPNCDYSIIWFSRGCFRNCPFCVVREKEGFIRPVEPKNLNPNGKFIKVMDNNFFGNPKWEYSIEKLHEWDQPVDIQGLDIRIMEESQAYALSTLKHYKDIKFAWDNPKENIDDKIELLLDYVSPKNLMCYVLIGFWSTMEEDLMRVYHLYDKYKIVPFAMPYDKSDEYSKRFCSWANRKKVFSKVDFEDFDKSHKTHSKDYKICSL